MLKELILFIKLLLSKGVVCSLTQAREARFGEWSIFTHDMATFWRFGVGESDSSFQGLNVLISKWQIWTGRSLKPNKLSFFHSLNLFIYSKTINWGHATCSSSPPGDCILLDHLWEAWRVAILCPQDKVRSFVKMGSSRGPGFYAQNLRQVLPFSGLRMAPLSSTTARRWNTGRMVTSGRSGRMGRPPERTTWSWRSRAWR